MSDHIMQQNQRILRLNKQCAKRMFCDKQSTNFVKKSLQKNREMQTNFQFA